MCHIQIKVNVKYYSRTGFDELYIYMGSKEINKLLQTRFSPLLVFASNASNKTLITATTAQCVRRNDPVLSRHQYYKQCVCIRQQDISQRLPFKCTHLALTPPTINEKITHTHTRKRSSQSKVDAFNAFTIRIAMLLTKLNKKHHMLKIVSSACVVQCMKFNKIAICIVLSWHNTGLTVSPVII